jgi:predicted ester cyclase
MLEAAEYAAVEHLAQKIVPLDEQRVSREEALGGHPMAAEENKALVRRYIEEALNKGNMAVIDALIVSDHVDHAAPPDRKPGLEGAREFARTLRAEWPDIQIMIEDQVAEGDKVVTRWTARATHTQPVLTQLGTIAPTHKQANVNGIAIDRIAAGKIVETWSNFDELGLLLQMGAVARTAQTAR